MILLFYLAGLACLIYVGMAASVISKGRHQQTHTIFFYLCLSLALWSLGASLFYVADTRERAQDIFRFFSVGYYFFPPALFLFFLVLSGRMKDAKRWYSVLFYLPGIGLYLVTLIEPSLILTVGQGKHTWMLEYNKQSFWYCFNILHYILFILAAIITLLRMRLRAVRTRERLQARAVLLSLVPTVAAAFVSGTLLPSFGVKTLPIVPILSVFWLSGVRYAMHRYSLLKFTPELIAEYLISRTMDMVLLIDPERRVLRANSQFSNTTGLGEDELVGKPVQTLFPDFEFPDARSENETRRETRLRTRTGDLIPVQILISPIFDRYEELIGTIISAQDLRLIQQLIQEISDRNEAEEAARFSDEKFQKIFRLSPVGISINNLDTGEYLDTNEAGGRISGFSREEIVGKTTRELDIWVSMEERERLLGKLKKEGRLRNEEVNFCRKDRRIITCLLSAEPIDILGAPCAIFALVDITAMKTIEEEYHKVQRLESIGVLAGGIAHDFNNILTAIMGNIALAKLSSVQDEELRSMLEGAEGACVRAKELTNQLLTFSKGGYPVRTRNDIREIIKKSVEPVTAGTGINVEYDFADDLSYSVFVDAPKMAQVFQNLAVNAVQAMSGKGTILVRGENESAGNGQYPVASGTPEQYIHISFADTGSGISLEHLPKVFDPFFTTKNTGTGLGLSIVYSIITKHRGTITVSSVLGKGTEFHIRLPLGDGF